MNKEKFNPETALLLAWQMALKASDVINCATPSWYSDRIKKLDRALKDYNNYIFKFYKNE